MHNKHEIPLLHIYFSAFAAWTLINLNTEVAGGGGGEKVKFQSYCISIIMDFTRASPTIFLKIPEFKFEQAWQFKN